MKIAIIGYGKMGHIIEKTARERGHHIVAIIDQDNTADFASHEFKSADVAIEFSRPDAAVENILASFAAGVPVVSGTTGWKEYLPEMKSICDKGEGTLLWSSNFSIGVNIFMAVNRYLSSIISRYPQYRPALEETHHIHKLDHPSGTAITLAEELIANDDNIKSWEEIELTDAPSDVLPVHAIRRDEVPGIHTVCWDSPVDTITISHSAKSREGFALGAVMAAEWLVGKQGYYTMSDFLQL
ncbi:MAG: 4-hydroxy-tetrahydrodipicolinate reductase [Muribaculaceae bacterium]|nr:4-hydroxy-tetrahydrodipicolinate reductase [Muribaculaceae bacterium]